MSLVNIIISELSHFNIEKNHTTVGALYSANPLILQFQPI